ncbi:MAG: hypothetical protein LH702_01715 [Phormidesmis sp. CAN_BIN44]|nr:hypothetical protein [Phormidesmis sp. CAN_BIN44]
MLGFQISASRSAVAGEPQSTITARSCAGLGNSLTKNDIELRGARLGFALDANTMGRAFQNFATDSLRLIENTEPFYSPVREAVTLNSSQGVQRNVVPDAVTSVLIVEFNSQGAITYSAPYNKSYFNEMKFSRGDIYLSSFEHQIIGYVDIASTSPAGVAPTSLGTRRPTPAVEFVTNSDAVIALNVITKFTQERVAVYQRIACDAPSTPSTTDMVVGARVPLNPEVYQNNFPVSFRPSGIVAGLRR